MKDDYLWDKTGEDAEIQALENALKAFRYQETAPPQKVFTLEKPKRAGFFHFRLAFAAFAAIVAVLSVVWLQTTDRQIPPLESAAENSKPRIENKINEEKFFEPREIKRVRTAFKPNVVKTRQKSAPVVSAEKAVLRNIKSKAPAETLTAEEKYAYDQLMLALSITGSKLKIVKDKIQGIEEQNAVLDTKK